MGKLSGGIDAMAYSSIETELVGPENIIESLVL
jgi:hypothetical protein